LSVDSIMRGPKLVGYPPFGLRWSGDSKDLYFEWRQPNEDEAATYVVARTGGEPKRLSDEERRLAPSASSTWDQTQRLALFVDRGDIALVDSVSRTRRQITRTTAVEDNPRFARHGTHVTFTRENNLFIVPIDARDGAIVEQLTDVGPKKTEPKLTESQKVLKEEDLKLIEHLREAEERRKKNEEKAKKDALPKFELDEGQSVVDLALSPDDRHVFMLVVDKDQGAKRADVPSYVTDSSYPELLPARTNVGDVQEQRRLAVLNLDTGKSVFATGAVAGPSAHASSEQPSGSTEASAGAGSGSSSGQGADQPGEGKGVRLRWSMPSFSKDGRYAVAFAESEDNNNRWLLVVDPDTGQSRVLDHRRDEAWVYEGDESGGGGGFLADDRRYWFLSERDGWMHLYTIDVSSDRAQPSQLTKGRFEVSSAELSPDKSTFYVVTNEVHPGERHIYSLPTDGGTPARITTMPGSHTPKVSPDESMIADLYSYTNKPPEVYLMRNEPAASPRQITTSPIEEWRSFKWADPQVLTFKARDGVEVPARLYTPEMMGARRDPSASAVVFVHGAGYLQNAHRYWSTYYREYMFHNLLASRGYVVLDVDYRASSGYGREWRTAIYRHMGGKDLDDIVDGAKFLVERHKVNPKRIGVYGGSYGGFITLMAMFTSPTTFAAGAALRPVTDWAHYNHGYTSNILNEPQSDREAYRKSSPIYFAEGLQGALLICHGMVDTNVHFQDSVRLVQRLIELRKENWELAVYPVENHAFERETSWADEYKRVLKLFDGHLRGRDAKATNQVH
jgi:dipeptidyl aminopeptidase/acylaminoacyl peptidase